MQVLNVSQSWECNSVVTSSGAISDSCSSKPGMIIRAWWYRTEISTFSSVIWWWTSIWMPFKFLMAVSACLAVAYRTILNLLGYKQKKKKKKHTCPYFTIQLTQKLCLAQDLKACKFYHGQQAHCFPTFGEEIWLAKATRAQWLWATRWVEPEHWCPGPGGLTWYFLYEQN